MNSRKIIDRVGASRPPVGIGQGYLEDSGARNPQILMRAPAYLAEHRHVALVSRSGYLLDGQGRRRALPDVPKPDLFQAVAIIRAPRLPRSNGTSS